MKFFLLFFLPAFVLAQNNNQDLLNNGVRAFKQGKYSEAVQAFEGALNAAPNDATTHLYLGLAHFSPWVPGRTTPENQMHASTAEREFQRVLALDPPNKTALASLAAIAFQQKKWDEAKSWYEKVLTVDSNDKVAYYTLGVIAWCKAFPVRLEARKKAGMRPEDPGPLPPSVRFDVANQNFTIVNDGIAKIQKALEIDPRYDDAAAYLNLLYREKADIEESADAYKADIQKADEMVSLTLEIKKSKQTSGGNSGRLFFPPPPATPPPPGARVDGATVTASNSVHIGGNVMDANLVLKTAPAYPPLAKQARISGTVRFNAVIGQDGRVISLQVVSGHPLLIPAAQDAVKQWMYRLTIFNGSAVEVQTSIDVNFTLAK